jgi:membrane protease YdiL (CAAX protease family)
MQLLYIAGKIIQFGTPLVWLAVVDRNAIATLSPRTLKSTASLDEPYVNGIRWGLAVGLLISAVIFMAYMGLRGSHLLLGVPLQLRMKLGQFDTRTPLSYAALGTFLAVINSGLEEYYWRWFIFGRLRNYMPVALGVVVSSLGFMAHHVIVLCVYFPDRFFTAALPFSLAIAFGGAVWAWIYHKSGSIVGPWISHLLVDVAVMLIGYDLAFHQ